MAKAAAKVSSVKAKAPTKTNKGGAKKSGGEFDDLVDEALELESGEDEEEEEESEEEETEEESDEAEGDEEEEETEDEDESDEEEEAEEKPTPKAKKGDKAKAPAKGAKASPKKKVVEEEEESDEDEAEEEEEESEEEEEESDESEEEEGEEEYEVTEADLMSMPAEELKSFIEANEIDVEIPKKINKTFREEVVNTFFSDVEDEEGDEEETEEESDEAEEQPKKKGKGDKAPRRKLAKVVKDATQTGHIVSLEIANLKTPKLSNRGKEAYSDERLESMKVMLKKHGQLQPILVAANGDVVEGNRRVGAAKLLGWEHIEGIVLPGDADLMDEAIKGFIANHEREDPSGIDKAKFFKRLMDKGLCKTQKDVARATGMSAPRVNQILSLLDLPGSLKSKLKSGELTTEQALQTIQARKRAGRVKSGQDGTGDGDGADSSDGKKKGNGKKVPGPKLKSVDLYGLENPKLDEVIEDGDVVGAVVRRDGEQFALHFTFSVAFNAKKLKSLDLAKRLTEIVEAAIEPAEKTKAVKAAIKTAVDMMEA